MEGQEQKGYCIRCQKHRIMVAPMRTKLRNPKTRNKTIETMRGKCPDCDTVMYHIVGHG